MPNYCTKILKLRHGYLKSTFLMRSYFLLMFCRPLLYPMRSVIWYWDFKKRNKIASIKVHCRTDSQDKADQEQVKHWEICFRETEQLKFNIHVSDAIKVRQWRKGECKRELENGGHGNDIIGWKKIQSIPWIRGETLQQVVRENSKNWKVK